MSGRAEFNALFGNITLSQLVMALSAMGFAIAASRHLKTYLDKRYADKQAKDEAEKSRNEQIKEALEAVSHYPEYREQSKKIQQELKTELGKIRESLQGLSTRVDTMEQGRKEEDLHKLRDLLIKAYNYYADPEKNPSGAWTRMEAESFWDLFYDYEAKGGDGYIHSTVQPAMERLRIIEMDDVPPRMFPAQFDAVK